VEFLRDFIFKQKSIKFSFDRPVVLKQMSSDKVRVSANLSNKQLFFASILSEFKSFVTFLKI
jgi:hypothetical protein